MNTIESKITIHKSDSRGYADHGWLKSRHTFSFASYYDPDRIQFGALRVLNDDIVSPGMGFGTHPHDNMEIVSIPIHGSIAHKDNTGTKEVIKPGEVQIMSAGTGITHSEYNHSATDKVNFLQIWVFPKIRNIKPRYSQKYFSPDLMHNTLLTVVAPDDEHALPINQDAWFSIGKLTSGHEIIYKVRKKGNGIYAFIIEGSAIIQDTLLQKRDGMGIRDVDQLKIHGQEDVTILLMDIPMSL